MSNETETINVVVDDTENAVSELEVETSTVISIDKKERVQRDAKGNTGTYVHKFRKLYEYEGKKYTTLNFYFDRLTGRDMIAIENEMSANGEYALDPMLSKSFQCKMAARACHIGSDVLEAMPIQEFNKIVSAARNFLIHTDD